MERFESYIPTARKVHRRSENRITEVSVERQEDGTVSVGLCRWTLNPRRTKTEVVTTQLTAEAWAYLIECPDGRAA